MSWWTYITGMIVVSPMGRTQPEKRYILDTVLAHLPKVTGSERDMHIHVIQKHGFNSSSSHNEFGQLIPYQDNQMQTEYILVLEASLRDRVFDETLRELNNFLNRLAKRLDVEDILIHLKGWNKEIIISNPKPYQEMAEWPSWWTKKSNGEPAWWEYLMWDQAKDSEYPLMLMYKHYNDPENDAEAERRLKYGREELYE